MITDLNESDWTNISNISLLSQSNFNTLVFFEDASVAHLAQTWEKNLKRGWKFNFKLVVKLGQIAAQLQEKTTRAEFKEWISSEKIHGLSYNKIKLYMRTWKFWQQRTQQEQKLLCSENSSIWNQNLLERLVKASPGQLERFFASFEEDLQQTGQLTYPILEKAVNKFLTPPKKYLTPGKPFSYSEDSALLTRKYNLTEQEALCVIIERAEAVRQQRGSDPVLLCDDILEALTALGYDTAVILPPPPKMSKQLAQAKAQVDQAEKVAQDALTKWHSAIATSQELSLQLKREKTKSAETIARLQTVHEKTITKWRCAIAQLQAVTEKTIAQLQAENQQLKLQLAQSQTAAPDPVPAIASINIPNPDAQTQVPPQTTARVNGDPHQASRESSLDIIDVDPETLAESALASPNQVTLNSTLWADVDANTLPVGEATGSKLDPAKSFIKGAVVGILNKSRKKCINYGKMVSVSGKKVSVSLFNGASKLFELKELCILEVPSTYKGFA
ncbi:hypothetical protein PCC7424_5636 (plasmid) [Gloeothece citriformis PCC 7424]|uniref:Uncharacterized protein n=1 Tax=Gloeothece citriformis (strain PCC 7424) TaxID=65393 RepID=B7KLP0_GLOC7|nr:hypothetical protein [Gloeothece citriformis]ACK73712.1 hypothetical protein PCC7424_5636 [Gloeothece citriformis PCC 7424]